jgi:hypothetical protein
MVCCCIVIDNIEVLIHFPEKKTHKSLSEGLLSHITTNQQDSILIKTLKGKNIIFFNDIIDCYREYSYILKFELDNEKIRNNKQELIDNTELITNDCTCGKKIFFSDSML